MKLFTYKCEECKYIFDKEYPYGENPESVVSCPVCGKEAYRYWGSSTIIIPEHFKATSSLYHNETPSDYHYMRERLKHGTRPSGKEKVYY